MFFSLLLIQGVAFGGFCGYLAGQKNRSGTSWFWLGFFFSILALIAIAASPSLANQKIDSLEEKSTRQCPFCAETVKAEAKICRYCQRDLPTLEPVVQDERAFGKCPNCSKHILLDSTGCNHCTARFDGDGWKVLPLL